MLSKMPGIGDVPILGQLFRSKNINHSVVELVVIVTPVIVDPLTDATPPAMPKLPVPLLDSRSLTKRWATEGSAATIRHRRPTVIQAKHNSDALQVAVLTVHVEQGTVEQIRQMAADMAWVSVRRISRTTSRRSSGRTLLSRRSIPRRCIAVIDFDGDVELALETAEFLRQSFYHKIAIVASLRKPIPICCCGPCGQVAANFSANPSMPTFTDTLTRLDQRWSATRGRQQNSGKLLSFFGAKGGVGTTTLAVHLAMFLVSVCKKKVLLIDNHAQLGQCAFTWDRWEPISLQRTHPECQPVGS